MFMDFDRDLGYAIEETQLIMDLLSLARLLASEEAVPSLPLGNRKRYMALLTQQAVWHSDTALDFFRLWPEHLEK